MAALMAVAGYFFHYNSSQRRREIQSHESRRSRGDGTRI
jgi:hypothetical protein